MADPVVGFARPLAYTLCSAALYLRGDVTDPEGWTLAPKGATLVCGLPCEHPGDHNDGRIAWARG